MTRLPLPMLAFTMVLLLGGSPGGAQEPRGLAPARHTVLRERWLAPDKAAHVFGGYWSAGAAYAVATELDADHAERRIAAAAAGVAAAVVKETYDRAVQKERFSWRDLAAGVAGTVLLVAITMLGES